MPDYDPNNLKLEEILSLRNYRNLEEYGIEFLTGEACAMGRRKLFDLTEEGIKHVERFFGGSIDIRRGTNTNPGSEASILLTGETVKELGLNIVWNEYPEADWFAVQGSTIYESTAETRALSTSLFHAEREDRLEELFETLEGMVWSYAKSLQSFREQGLRWQRGQGLTSHPHRGDKNVHAFSGQTHPA